MTYTSDIPLSLAVAAYGGISMSPERRGASVVSSYAAEMREIYDTLKAHAERGGTLDKLDEEFARFRSGYAAKQRAWLSSKGRCISSFITGPSNFPVRRAEKRNDIEYRRMCEVIDFKARAMKAIIRNLRPDLRPIMAGDADACERLEAEIRAAELTQARMKEANAAIRKHAKAGHDAQIVALVEMGFTDARASLLLKPDFCGRIGFADYQLTNNGANIRRMKERLERISRAKATPDSEIEGGNGVVVNDCPAENRIRITFPGKPAADVRAKLKSNGFRWTPSLGVWQAYRNSHTLQVAKSFTLPQTADTEEGASA